MGVEDDGAKEKSYSLMIVSRFEMQGNRLSRGEIKVIFCRNWGRRENRRGVREDTSGFGRWLRIYL